MLNETDLREMALGHFALSKTSAADEELNLSAASETAQNIRPDVWCAARTSAAQNRPCAGNPYKTHCALFGRKAKQIYS